MRRIGLAVVLALSLTPAPLEPISPSGSVDSLTGLYGGDVFTPSGYAHTHISATLVQVGDQVAGVWITGTGTSGTIAGTVANRSRLNWEGLQTVPCPGSLKGFAAIKDRGILLEGQHSVENCNGQFEASFRVHRELLVGISDQRIRSRHWCEPTRLSIKDEPAVSRVAVLWQPGGQGERADIQLPVAEVAARALGVRLQILEARGPTDFDRAFSEMTRARADALYVVGSHMFFTERRRLVNLAAQNRLPALSAASSMKNCADVG